MVLLCYAQPQLPWGRLMEARLPMCAQHQNITNGLDKKNLVSNLCNDFNLTIAYSTVRLF